MNNADEILGIMMDLRRTGGFRFVMGVPPNSSKSFDHDLDGEEISRDSRLGVSLKMVWIP